MAMPNHPGLILRQPAQQSLEWRAALRRLGLAVDPDAKFDYRLGCLQAFEDRRILCDWFLMEQQYGVRTGFEFHTNVDMHLTPQSKMEVFEAGLRYMFVTLSAGVLTTYVPDQPGEADNMGMRVMLRSLGFQQGPLMTKDGKAVRYYQLMKEDYDARSTVRTGSSLGGGDSQLDVQRPEAAPGISPAG